MRVNQMMGLFWLCAGGTLLGARALGKEIEGVHPDRGLFIGVFAMVLATYNFVRWWAARARQKARDAATAEPSRKRPVEKAPSEYHPEFDFTRPEPPKNGRA